MAAMSWYCQKLTLCYKLTRFSVTGFSRVNLMSNVSSQSAFEISINGYILW